MPTTKLIYGVGRVPKASEFSLGEIIVNVDDSKVYSKNKSNVVFEIGGGGGTTIIGGESDGLGFSTASIESSGFFTSADTSNLIVSGGTGISVTLDSNNHITITATGDSEVTNAITASYAHTAELAYTASYVNTSNLDGNLFEFANDGGQGGIIFSENNIDIYSTVGAYAAGLSETSDVIFAQVSSSGLLFASLSYDDTPITHISGGVVVYDSSSGRFYYTGSYGGGGGNDGDWYDGGTFLSSSVPIRVEGWVSSSRLILDSTVDLRNLSDELYISATGITGDSGVTSLSFPVGAGGNFTLLDDTMLNLSVGAGATNINIGAATSITTIADNLKVLGSITASNDISASGLLYASASQPAAHSDSIVAVVYDTGSGRFYYTGSYGAGGDDNDWYIDTGNNRLTSSFDLLLTSSNQNQYIYFNSGNVNDITNIKNAYISNTISDTTYGQEIKLENYYNEGVIELEIGTDPYITAKKNTNPVVIINSDAKNIDFNVKGDTDADLIYADAGNDKVGIGYNTPTEKLSVDGNIFAKEDIYIGSAAGTHQIQFNKSVNANSATTAEVSILADNSGYKQSLNFYNVLPTGRYSSLTIGTNEYFKANFNNGARADKYFIINGDDDGVDFIVSGSNFPDLLVAAVDSDNVGVGYGSSSLSAAYGDYKLAVSGNLYSDGYLTLASKDNTTGVAGALLYSSSNEFYLGFS